MPVCCCLCSPCRWRTSVSRGQRSRLDRFSSVAEHIQDHYSYLLEPLLVHTRCCRFPVLAITDQQFVCRPVNSVILRKLSAGKSKSLPFHFSSEAVQVAATTMPVTTRAAATPSDGPSTTSEIQRRASAAPAQPYNGPNITNIVCGVHLNCIIDLKNLALSARNAYYNPKR